MRQTLEEEDGVKIIAVIERDGLCSTKMAYEDIWRITSKKEK